MCRYQTFTINRSFNIPALRPLSGGAQFWAPKWGVGDHLGGGSVGDHLGVVFISPFHETSPEVPVKVLMLVAPSHLTWLKGEIVHHLQPPHHQKIRVEIPKFLCKVFHGIQVGVMVIAVDYVPADTECVRMGYTRAYIRLSLAAYKQRWHTRSLTR